MPAFRLNGRFLVSYAAYKHHCSLFPASAAVQEACGVELEPYFQGKGDDPVPAGAAAARADLVRRIIEVRVGEIETGSGTA